MKPFRHVAFLLLILGCSAAEPLDTATPPSGTRGDLIAWTADAPIDIEVDATRYRVFIGNMTQQQADRIRELNPSAIRFQYLMARYIHQYFESLWQAEAGDNADAGYLHRIDGSIILAPDAAKPWPVANILPGSPYRSWLIAKAAELAAYTDGMMIDNPMPFVEWVYFQNPVECTEDEYKAACLSFITDLKAVIGKPVVINLSTLWWYQSGLDNARLQQAAANADGVYFQSGGCWTLGPLQNKWIFMGGQTPLVYVGEDR